MVPYEQLKTSGGLSRFTLLYVYFYSSKAPPAFVHMAAFPILDLFGLKPPRFVWTKTWSGWGFYIFQFLTSLDYIRLGRARI